MKVQLGPTEILFPVPAALISCGTMKRPNIITVAWICMLDNSPPTVGFSLEKTRYSLQLIREHKYFSVNIASSNHFVEADYCGITSGRKVDKFQATKFTAIQGAKSPTPLIKECPFNLECEYVKELFINDRIFIVGEILETHIDEDKVKNVKQMKLDISRLDPIVYCTQVREYWTIGKKIGNAFSVGKKLLTK